MPNVKNLTNFMSVINYTRSACSPSNTRGRLDIPVIFKFTNGIDMISRNVYVITLMNIV